MILIDTSVWVDLLGKARRFSITQAQLMEVATCNPIVQEVLQGISGDLAYRKIKDAMLSFPLLSPEMNQELYLEAAEIYRIGRRRGLTIRSSVDCLIAAISIENDVAVWHADRDFEAIARFTKLKVYSKI